MCVCVRSNEVMTVVNSKVTCPTANHAANSGYCVVLNDVRCGASLSAGPF